MRSLPLTVILIAFAAAGSGCGTSQDLAAEANAVGGTASLVDYLSAQGFALEPSGLTSSTVPLAVTSTYRVVGTASATELEIFEFPSPEDAEGGLTSLRSEVRSRSRQSIYAAGPLVVYLRGEEYGRPVNQRLQSALARALGPVRGDA